ncbi:MAG: hypothetical protein F6K19_08865 [Cyanothece sp. SIO1E1]|nr:hypothetical protein [Cyanothece sp. SIO1E1]
MPFLAKVYKVLISGPTDVSGDIDKVKKAIYEWNSINSGNNGIIFLPLHWKTNTAPKLGKGGPQPIINKQLTDRADLVIALFRSRIGTETDSYISGTVEEIYEVKNSGKIVSVYFIDDQTKVSELDIEQLKKLQEFKKNLEGLYYEVKDSNKLESDLKDHLSILIDTEEYFLDSELSNEEGIQIKYAFNNSDYDLTELESNLIVEASYDQNGSIIVATSKDGLSISTNNKSFLDRGIGRDRAKWENSIDKLESLSLIESKNINNTVYNLTEIGYEYVENKNPYSNLSKDSKILLKSAAQNQGIISIIKVGSSYVVETYGMKFSDGEDNRNGAKWKSKVEELENRGLVEAKDYKRESFEVTNRGYEFVEENDPFRDIPDEMIEVLNETRDTTHGYFIYQMRASGKVLSSGKGIKVSKILGEEQAFWDDIIKKLVNREIIYESETSHGNYYITHKGYKSLG